MSLYYSVLYLGINELAPVNEPEIICCIFLLVASIIFMTIVLSDVAVLFQGIASAGSKAQSKIDEAMLVLNYIELPERQQKQIFSFYHKTSFSKNMQDEFDSFFGMISPNRKLLVQKYLFMTMMRKNRIIRRFVGDHEPSGADSEDVGICGRLLNCCRGAQPKEEKRADAY